MPQKSSKTAPLVLVVRGGRYLARLFKHPRWAKFMIPWVVTNLNQGENSIKGEIPWITFEAKEWLEKFLKPEMNVFEYGSGGSTLFLASRVKNLISIEHDREWYQYLSGLLANKNIANCQYLLVEPRPNTNKDSDVSDPKNFISKSYPSMSFENYVKSIDAFPDQSFDLILVDGRARPSCLVRAIKKLRAGGALMLDDSERPYYDFGKQLVAQWSRIDFFGPGPYDSYFWQTSVWEKPANSLN